MLKTEIISPDLDNYDCHSPTILGLQDRCLIAAWFGGYGEGRCDDPAFTEKVGIWISRFDGNKWSFPELVASHRSSKCWNPVLHSLPSGELILFYKLGDNPREWYGALKRSSNKGKTWSDEEMLPAAVLGPIKNKVLEHTSGSLICGSSVEAGDRVDPFKATSCWIEIASPSLDKWEKFGPIEIPQRRFGALQPSLYFGDHGHLHLLCRDRAHRIGQKGFIWHAVSSDLGKTWSQLENTGLPNPDSGIDTLKVDKNRVFLVYNPSHQNRFPLSLALSENDGKDWKDLFVIDKDKSEYPYIISTQDGTIHIVYAYSNNERKQRRIKHAILSKD